MHEHIISKTYIEKEMDIHNVPGMGIAVIHNGEKLMSEGFGYKNLEKKLPITSKTQFGIASCSKSFTSALISMLVDEGVLSFDLPIKEYLSDFKLFDPVATELCTLRDILCHRTGLASHDALWVDNISRAELFKRMRYIEPNTSFRNMTQYNNTMYTIAGHIAERVTGESWEELVSKRIFKPLGMVNTNCSIDRMVKSSDFATPYWDNYGELIEVNNWNVDLGGPAASINSSLDDMIKWVEFNIDKGVWNNDRLISKENMDQMHHTQTPYKLWPWNFYEVPPVAGYGLGWFTDVYRGKDLVFHYGEIEGYCTLQAFLPKENIGVMIFVNVHKPSTLILNSVLYTIIDNLLELEPIDWSTRFKNEIGKYGEFYYHWDVNILKEKPKKGTKLKHNLNEYIGEYNNPGYGDFEIVLEGNSLKGIYRGVEESMQHYHYETFKVPNIKMDTILLTSPLTFKTSPFGGIVDSFEIILEPEVAPIIFTKIN